MVVFDVLPEVIVVLMWGAGMLWQCWEEHMGWDQYHGGSWRFVGRGDETGTGYVGEQQMV